MALSVLMIIACSGNNTPNRQRRGSYYDTTMYDGPGSMYIPEEDRLDEVSTQTIKADVRAFVESVYDEVNRRWANDYVSQPSDSSLEQMFTTRKWQKLYAEVRSIESQYTQSDEKHFFVEGGNTWTMGSFDAPFQVKDLVVNAIDKRNAYASFQLLPAESEGSDILWELEVEDGVWRINNFIDDTPDPDSGETDRFDYTEHMQAYYKAHINKSK